MTIILSNGDRYENINRCLVTYRNGTERTFNADNNTGLIYINVSEIACMAIQAQ
jgi:hypothetical protein